MMWVKLAAGGIMVLLVLAGAFYVARLPSLMIADVEVRGAELVDAAKVRELVERELEGTYALLIPRANAFFAPRGEIEKLIKESFPPVASVTLSHRELETLVVTLAERTPSGVWCQMAEDGGYCYLMDKGGYIYALAETREGHVRYSGDVTGEPVGQTYLSGTFKELHAFVEETGKTLNLVPASVLVEANGDAALTFTDGGVLRFVRTGDTEATLTNIASVFASQGFKSGRQFEYADFRYGNKVYVKFVGE
jgi:cell division septal protein FtsQ